MLRASLGIQLIILLVTINEIEVKETFKSTAERWTIKIRGGRDVAEIIARERGFEIYHEVSYLLMSVYMCNNCIIIVFNFSLSCTFEI